MQNGIAWSVLDTFVRGRPLKNGVLIVHGPDRYADDLERRVENGDDDRREEAVDEDECDFAAQQVEALSQRSKSIAGEKQTVLKQSARWKNNCLGTGSASGCS